MNERDSKLIYRLKQKILKSLWSELGRINGIEDYKTYLIIKKDISETVEKFLHPEQEE